MGKAGGIDNGHVISVIDSDLKHQPAYAEALNQHIEKLRGKPFDTLVTLFRASKDEVEQEAIRVYGIGHFRRDPLDTIDDDMPELE